MSQPDYYQLLGVSVDASAVELEAAYRRITALFGPDANPEPFAAKIHAAATDAWRVLSDPARREMYDRLRSGRAPQGGEGVPPNRLHLGDVEGPVSRPDSGFDEDIPPSNRHYVFERFTSTVRERTLLEQILSLQFIAVFVVSAVCLWLTPWLCYNILWPSRKFGMMIDLSKSFVMAVALPTAFWIWIMLLDHVPLFRPLGKFLLYTREGQVIAGVVLCIVLSMAFRHPFVEIPGTVAGERECDWDFSGPLHSVYYSLWRLLPTYYLLVLGIGYNILKRWGLLNHAAEGKQRR